PPSPGSPLRRIWPTCARSSDRPASDAPSLYLTSPTPVASAVEVTHGSLVYQAERGAVSPRPSNLIRVMPAQGGELPCRLSGDYTSSPTPGRDGIRSPSYAPHCPPP